MAIFDFHSLLQILAAAAVGAIIGLDRTAFGQVMISQPVVAGPLAGWLLGDAGAGFIVGAVLELIWVLDMPVGTFVPADATIGTVSATAIAALSHPGGAGLPVIGFSILLTVFMVPVTMKAEHLIRDWNSRLADAVLTAPVRDAASALAAAQRKGLAAFFLKSFVLYCLFIPLGIAAAVLFDRLPAVFPRAMALFVKLLPLLGVALIMRKLSVRTLDLSVFIGILSGVVFGQLMHVPALAVMVLTVLAGWLGVRVRERYA